ncbi:MAG: DUF222 domain-containing protein [Candidatus Nanopelagicales bacterium]
MFESRSLAPLASEVSADAPAGVTANVPRTASERLADLAACSPTSSFMSELSLIDPSKLSGDDAITWLQAHERMSAWWASLQPPAIVRAAGPDRYASKLVIGTDVLGDSAAGPVTIADAIREELAAALRLSPATAQARIDSARLLCGPLSATHAAQSAGSITASHVAIIVSAASRLSGIWQEDAASREAFFRHCDHLQRRVLPVAIRSTLARTRRAAKRAVIAVDPADALRRRQQSLAGRDVYVIDDLDGVSTLIARMATEHAHACLSVINTLAARCAWAGLPAMPSPESEAGAGTHAGAAGGNSFTQRQSALSAGEKRSLAIASLLLNGNPQDPPGDMESPNQVQAPFPRPRAHINLTIDLPTLLALRDGAAELIGAGALPADVARELLADATFRRVITDSATGELLDYGRRTYAVPERLRQYIAARDQTCRFPGCGTAASRCEIDHAIPWSRGGATDRGNLGALCTRHHQMKTHGGWQLTDSDHDGGCTWISPQGREYEHRPRPVLEQDSVSSASPRDGHPSRLEPSRLEPSHLEPSHLEPSHLEPSRSDPDRPLCQARGTPPPF